MYLFFSFFKDAWKYTQILYNYNSLGVSTNVLISVCEHADIVNDIFKRGVI